MLTLRRPLYLTLILTLCLGLLAPVWALAEEPAPATPGAPAETPATTPTLLWKADQLLDLPPAPLGCNRATHEFTRYPSLPITGYHETISAIQLTGLDPYLWDVDVFTDISHTYNEDIDMVLVSPEGTEVTLTTDNGGSDDDVFKGTTWDDQWVGPSVEDYPYVDQTAVPHLSPEEALAAFRGENPNGTWTLYIFDDNSQDNGMLNEWDLSLTTLDTAPNVVKSLSVSRNTSWSIPDFGEVEIPLYLYPPDLLSHLTLETQITHSYSHDLDMYLIAPNHAMTMTLSTGHGLADSFSNTLWTDTAGDINPPGAVSDTQFADGEAETALVPENAFDAFVGYRFSGDWTLLIRDTASGDTGTVNFVALKAEISTCLPDVVSTQAPASDYFPIGENVEFQITATSQDFAPVTNVVLTDTLPTGTRFLEWVAAPGWTCETPPVGETGQVVCRTDSMQAGMDAFHTLRLQPVAAPQGVQNVVEVGSTDPEYNLNNSSESWAQITYRSANGNFWDVVDGLDSGYDTGAVADGGQDAFDGWGLLRLRVLDAENNILLDNRELAGFDLLFTGQGWISQNAVTSASIRVTRALYAPADTNYVRYLDTFTNTSAEPRTVWVAWGGALGSDDKTTLAASNPTWALTIQNAAFDPAGPADDPPVGYVYRNADDPSIQWTGDMALNPFETSWSGNGNDDIGFVFVFALQPGETQHLLNFVYRGLAEEVGGPAGCTTNCITPPAGSEIALAQTTLAALATAPDVCDLSGYVLTEIVNWPGIIDTCPNVNFPVFLPSVIR